MNLLPRREMCQMAVNGRTIQTPETDLVVHLTNKVKQVYYSYIKMSLQMIVFEHIAHASVLYMYV